MAWLQPRSTRPDTLCPAMTLFRSDGICHHAGQRALPQLAGEEPAHEVGLWRGGPLEEVLEQLLAGGHRSGAGGTGQGGEGGIRSEEHTSELQSLMRISYAVFCLKTHNNCTSRQRKHTQNNIW